MSRYRGPGRNFSPEVKQLALIVFCIIVIIELAVLYYFKHR